MTSKALIIVYCVQSFRVTKLRDCIRILLLSGLMSQTDTLTSTTKQIK